MWEANALRAGITSKLLSLYGHLSNHYGCTRAVLQGLWESNLSAGNLVTDFFNAHKLFRQLILKFYLDFMFLYPKIPGKLS